MNELRRQRESLGLGVRELGRLLGVSGSYLCNIEHGRNTLPLPTIVRLGPLGFDVRSLAVASVRDRGYVEVPWDGVETAVDVALAAWLPQDALASVSAADDG